MEGIISSGSLRLDIALGIGGIPRGRFIEISGSMSSGKTTLCQHIVAEAQKLGDPCAWIDLDHTFDPAYALSCGVCAERLYICDPMEAVQALEILETLSCSGSMTVVVFDSITSLTSQEERQSTFDEPNLSVNDRCLSQTLRRLNRVIEKNGTTVIFTDQKKWGISRVYHRLSQNPSRLALKLHAGLCLELRALQNDRIGDKNLGARIQARIIKNDFYPCAQRIEFDIIYDIGIIKTGEIFDLGTQLKIIRKQKSKYFFEDRFVGANRKEALGLLDQNTHMAQEIEQIIRQKMLPDLYPAAR